MKMLFSEKFDFRNYHRRKATNQFEILFDEQVEFFFRLFLLGINLIGKIVLFKF